MRASINSTDDYYRNEGQSLGWELTVSNALHPENSPCRKILRKGDSYGTLLFEYLSRFLPMDRIERVIEIGGGYGYLMRNLLTHQPRIRATMLDISPFLSEIQRETLKGFEVLFRVEDFLGTPISVLHGIDMAIFNENLGDFPTALDVPRAIFQSALSDLDETLARVRRVFEAYGFPIPEMEFFPVNLGAVEALEKVCRAGVPYVFLSEHSCEARVPQPSLGLIRIRSLGYPERITLRGHDEYSIRFSHLEGLARALGYRTLRGPLADFLEPRFDDRLRHILSAPTLADDTSEIIRHFVEDLYKYEYLLLIREDVRNEDHKNTPRIETE